MRTGLLLLAAALSGCTVIGHEKIEGWPALEMVEHYVSHKEMRDRCGKYTGPFSSPEACAEFNLETKRCDIWYSADFPPPQFVVEHERLHCSGVDHIGETEMRDFFTRWRASKLD